MSLLITGAKGYIGRHLLEQLGQSDGKCYAADQEEFNLLDIDSIRSYFNGKNISRVIHLAGAVEVKNPGMLFDVNIQGLYNLLCVCAENKIEHFAFASSNVVYGESREGICSVETFGEPAARNSYALSKYMGELLVSDFCRGHNMRYANVRIGDVYGPNQKVGNLIKAIVQNAAEGKPLALYGSGIRTRDYIFVTDVADGLLFISRNQVRGAVNLGTGVGTSVAELIQIGVELSEGLSTVEQVDTDREDVSKIVLDVSVLKSLGFQTKVSVRDGLGKCIAVRREQ